VGGAIRLDSSSVNITRSLIDSNSAAYGGGVATQTSALNISDSTLNRNRAEDAGAGNGGAIKVIDGEAYIEQTTFHSNTADLNAVIQLDAGTAEIGSSLIAFNNSASTTDFSDGVISRGYNLTTSSMS